ncbi:MULTISPECIES: hypothetical protein [unclassified Pseudomonas]|nr:MULTISPECIES: hypothetical protein [unclassified Pseudomonas]
MGFSFICNGMFGAMGLLNLATPLQVKSMPMLLAITFFDSAL